MFAVEPKKEEITIEKIFSISKKDSEDGFLFFHSKDKFELTVGESINKFIEKNTKYSTLELKEFLETFIALKFYATYNSNNETIVVDIKETSKQGVPALKRENDSNINKYKEALIKELLKYDVINKVTFIN